jgi:hypothetical protein
MMQQGQDENIYGIWNKAHTGERRFTVADLCRLLGHKYAYEKGPYISYQCTGGGMQTWRFCKEVKSKTKQERKQYQPPTGHLERKPENVYEVKIWDDELMQGRDLPEYKYLEQDEESKAEYIFQQDTH